jgi:hypothetical protein
VPRDRLSVASLTHMALAMPLPFCKAHGACRIETLAVSATMLLFIAEGLFGYPHRFATVVTESSEESADGNWVAMLCPVRSCLFHWNPFCENLMLTLYIKYHTFKLM